MLIGVIGNAVISRDRAAGREGYAARIALDTAQNAIVDEETGVRGFAATRDRVFLEPYVAAVQAVKPVLASLGAQFTRERFIAAAPAVADLRQSYEDWSTRVNEPIIHAPPSATLSKTLQLGKVYVDRMRLDINRANAVAQSSIDRAAEETQRAVSTSVSAIVLFTALVGVAAIWLEYRQRTRLLTLQTELRDRNAALERSNASLQEFAYVASHDLQEPLRTIVSFTQLLQRRYGGKIDASADEFIAFTVDAAQRMQTLINDILQLSRVTTQGKPLVATDLAAVVARATTNLRETIAERSAVIQADSLPMVMGDASQLTQLMQNFIGNGIKYNRSEPPVIRVSAEEVGTMWRVAVADNGIGISPEYHDKIFRIFQRLHSRSEFSGTGIGLALAKNIVERHGGTVSVASDEGKGATFYFTLRKATIGEEAPS